MDVTKTQWFPHVTREVVADAGGFKLCGYLIALEGWRRGLALKWYAENETNGGHVKKIGWNFLGKTFSLGSETDTSYHFRSRGSRVTDEAVDVCTDKQATKEALQAAGVPVPKGKAFPSEATDEELTAYAAKIGFPVVLKPVDGSLGKGVYTNIQNEAAFTEALADLRTNPHYSTYMVETYHRGREYRIYTVGDKVIGAIHRIPANVTGDGEHTVQALIDLKNQEKKSNPYLAGKPITIDFEVNQFIERRGYTLDSVPPEGEVLYLRGKSNLSAGGDPLDATDELTPKVKQLAVDALKAVPGLGHAGIDIIVDDEDDSKSVVLEVNATAEIGFHVFPMSGKARDIPAAIIDYYYPETIGKPKSTLYFDYRSVLEPLRTRAVDMVEVAPAPAGTTHAKKYRLIGDVQDLGYRNWIRNRALEHNLNGEAELLKDDSLAVIVAGTSEAAVDQFKYVFYQNSDKAIVDGLIEQPWEEPVKVGFEVKKRKKASRTKKLEQALAKEKQESEKAMQTMQQQLDEAVKQQQAALKKAERALKQKEEAVRQKQEAVKQKQEAIKQKQAALEQKEQALKQKRTALKEKEAAEQQKQQIEDRYNRIENSNTWRYTAPIRRAVGRIKKQRR